MDSDGPANPEAKGSGGKATSTRLLIQGQDTWWRHWPEAAAQGKGSPSEWHFMGSGGMFCAGRRGTPAPGVQIRPVNVGWCHLSRASWGSDNPSRRPNVRLGALRLTQGQLKRSLNEMSSETELGVSKTPFTID